ncbi:MAG TPA: (2Fe-2S)-binding protein [Coprothermobacter proteolyticus]|uniref:(2Fe-2S)-binding protein n=1 Tax=Coprothermobacter proteolyticus TaxID=35786 RepID=UPI000A4B12EE|nr:(2Fe-2S)-binding protein [Coprothermobacter proteolyticus]MBK6586434.1 (2Fe-2S)-binding protein [Coprothermobacter sp.]NLT83391.1 (2Fe-2S)-binding protein [Coprothermobacter proteolyticus]HOA64593.1 (2Fe-2S)-binding protein [Coprothermobacter proteolyticus]HOL53014.1 (2Fe-2S)-binding protein [Coprothermobacter proteolyticus]HOP45472.1 (2Fe-2S)-binding protein [Coprothermobacter proteolyticus]
MSRRIQEHPILEFPSTKEVTIFFEGRQIIAHEGDTVASALIANGIDVLRESMNLHRPRGLFCAIGNCSSCLMVINGVPNTRACITPVTEGMTVERQRDKGMMP